MIISQNVPLSDKTWFRTGGLAAFYAEPQSDNDFCQALLFAQEKRIETFVLGEGANILISDDGFDGLVIRPVLSDISYLRNGFVRAQAGASIEAIINYSLTHNLVGLEEFSGIPGTLGGSVYINIHYFDSLLSDFLVEATVIERSTGQILRVDNAWFQFGYNKSRLQSGQWYLIDATLKLKQVDVIASAYARGRRDEIVRHRRRRYPNSRTCGSFFRNFTKEEAEQALAGEKVPFVAYYLDKVGLKGALSRGKAGVSYQHANMIVTQKNALTADVIAVARAMQERVRETFGLTPQPECQFIGFKDYPLHKAL